MAMDAGEVERLIKAKLPDAKLRRAQTPATKETTA